MSQQAAFRIGLLTSVFGISFLLPGAGHASDTLLPASGQVTAGSATITGGNGQMLITQSSSRAVIDWQHFSIGRDASVTFDMPNAGSAVLNRVTGGTSSTIAGTLSANGQVYLVNPNGIAITGSGSVKVGGGFVASALDLTNDDFLGGRLRFSGSSTGVVSNAGTIEAGEGGFAALIAHGGVENGGLISVPAGQVALGAGSAITLDPTGTGFMQILAPATGEEDGTIGMGGRIRAEGGRVEIRAATAAKAVRDIVNVSGEVSVSSVRRQGGTIILDGGNAGVRLSGRLDAASQQARGGRIAVGGKRLTLQGAKIDASGTSGGTVSVGGGRQGASVPGATTAEAVWIDGDTAIEASGTAGAGGDVTVWSDFDTQFFGTITAMGNGGNGGEAEVSSLGAFTFQGTVNLLSQGGRAGNLLLDPYNVTISSAADANQSGFTATGTGAVINVTSLQNALETASVTVLTGSSGAEAGHITVSNAISWSADTTLTLAAAGGIIINAAVTASGTGSGLTLSAATAAGVGGNSSGTIASNGTLTINLTHAGAAGVLYGGVSGSGNLVLTGIGTQVLQGTNTYTGSTTISGGTLSIGGSATLANGSHTGIIDIASGARLRYSSSANQILSGIISGAGGITKDVSNTSTLTLTGANTYSGSTTVSTGILKAGSSAALGSNSAVTVSTGATLDIGGQPIAIGTLAGAGTVTNSGADVTLTMGGNNINATFSGTIQDGAGKLSLLKVGSAQQTFSGTIRYSGTTTLNTGNLQIGGSGLMNGLYAGDIALYDGTMRMSMNSDQILSGTITGGNVLGGGSILKDGGATSTLTILNAKAHTGPVTVGAGTLKAGSADAFGSTSTYTINGTLDLGGYSVTLNGLNGNTVGRVTNSGAAATLTVNSGGFSGVIQDGAGKVSLVKLGSGTLAMGGVHTYTGDTAVNGGTFQVNGAGQLGGGSYAGAINLTGGTLRWSASTDQTLSGVISGTGGLNKDLNPSTLTLTAANTFTGAITLSAGTIHVAGAGVLGGGNYAGDFGLSAGTTFRYSSSTDQRLSGRITGGSLVKDTSATSVLTLAGSNSYSGSTMISAGTLRVASSSSLSGNSALTVAAGALLDLGGFSNTIASLSGSGTSATRVPQPQP